MRNRLVQQTAFGITRYNGGASFTTLQKRLALPDVQTRHLYGTVAGKAVLIQNIQRGPARCEISLCETYAWENTENIREQEGG